MELNKFIGNKIKSLRETKGMSQIDLAHKLNVTQQTISRYESGNRKTDQDVLFDLAEIFNVGIDDFFPKRISKNITKRQQTTIDRYLAVTAQDKINDYVDMVFNNEEYSNKTDNTKDSNNVINLSDYKKQYSSDNGVHEEATSYTSVPTLDLRPSAGTGTSYGDIETSVKTFSNVPTKLYDYSVQVNGDSMEPKIKNHEWIFIKRQSVVEPGEIGIFELNNESFVKKFFINNEGHYELHSLNPKYAPIIISEDDDFRCEGLVIFF